MIIECINGSLTKEEQLEIQNHASEFEIEFDNREHVIINAAFDELVSPIVVWLSSQEVTAIVNAIQLLTVLCFIVKKAIKAVRAKRIGLINSDLERLKTASVIIQVENVKILELPENATITLNDYLSLALPASIHPSIPKDREIYISYDNQLHIETIDQYARRKMKMQ